MRTVVVAVGLVGVLAFPAGASATKPVDKTNAAKECKAERGTEPATQEAFVAKYGKNKKGTNAFGKCVSQTTHEEAAERKAARKAGKKACKAKVGKKGYRKCVAAKARRVKAKKDAADVEESEEFKNDAKECAAERTEIGDEAFAEKYGTNKDAKKPKKAKNGNGNGNAFGKCVSSKANTNS